MNKTNPPTTASKRRPPKRRIQPSQRRKPEYANEFEDHTPYAGMSEDTRVTLAMWAVAVIVITVLLCCVK